MNKVTFDEWMNAYNALCVFNKLNDLMVESPNNSFPSMALTIGNGAYYHNIRGTHIIMSGKLHADMEKVSNQDVNEMFHNLSPEDQELAIQYKLENS